MKCRLWIIVLVACNARVWCMNTDDAIVEVEQEATEVFSVNTDIEDEILEPKLNRLREPKPEKLNKCDIKNLLYEKQTKEKPNKRKEEQKPANVWGISPHDLGTLAPVSIVMYCFNQHPKFTMVALAGLLLVVLCQSDSTKTKIARFRTMVTHRLHCLKGHMLYMISRTRF